MGRIGAFELILIFAIALVVFGPSKLPQLGNALGSAIKEFRKGANDISKDLSLSEQPAPQQPVYAEAQSAPQPTAQSVSHQPPVRSEAVTGEQEQPSEK